MTVVQLVVPLDCRVINADVGKVLLELHLLSPSDLQPGFSIYSAKTFPETLKAITDTHVACV